MKHMFIQYVVLRLNSIFSTIFVYFDDTQIKILTNLKNPLKRVIKKLIKLN